MAQFGVDVVEDLQLLDIKLQSKVVLESFDILATAGKANMAVVKEFKGIEAGSAMVLELLARTANPNTDQAPIINFIEVVREDSINVAGIPAGGAQ